MPMCAAVCAVLEGSVPPRSIWRVSEDCADHEGCERWKIRQVCEVCKVYVIYGIRFMRCMRAAENDLRDCQ
jgi:hypothetical protein